jgi:hypothetical protein
MKKIFKIMFAIFIIILILWSIFCLVYRFKNPERTQTQLFYDMFNGNMFKKKENKNEMV